MRFPRMTTRRWMVAVAAVAILVGGFVFVQRSRERLMAARKIANAERVVLFKIQATERHGAAGQSSSALVHLRTLLARVRRERERYERSARYPWLPVEPDPPEPK